MENGIQVCFALKIYDHVVFFDSIYCQVMPSRNRGQMLTFKSSAGFPTRTHYATSITNCQRFPLVCTNHAIPCLNKYLQYQHGQVQHNYVILADFRETSY